MKNTRLWNAAKLLTTGMILLQAGGCTTTMFLDFVQTILLGVTAAGSVAILSNI